jgi:hypothetical protein
MNYNNLIVDFFTGMRGIDDLFESIYEGLYGGVQRYKVQPNEGNFDKYFLIKFVNIGDFMLHILVFFIFYNPLNIYSSFLIF